MPRISTDQDLVTFRHSPGYKDYLVWTSRRAERVLGRSLSVDIDHHGHNGGDDGNDDQRKPADHGTSYVGSSSPVRTTHHPPFPRVDRAEPPPRQTINHLLHLLHSLTTLIDSYPPAPDPSQRFGSKTFRPYIQHLNTLLPSLLHPLALDPVVERELLALWRESRAFGHETRLDYGTGHETGFILGLWVLVRRGVVRTEEEEDDLILLVFPTYLNLTNLLQKTYRLEPAGSHGVWGLDDYHFLPYLFGAGQCLGLDLTPTQTLTRARDKTVPTEEIKDLWTLSLRRVFQFKSGPFWEHSPLLHNLTTFPSFVKIARGLGKMYEEEVLGKRVVVQHLILPDWVWTGEGLDDRQRSRASAAAGEGAAAAAGEVGR